MRWARRGLHRRANRAQDEYDHDASKFGVQSAVPLQRAMQSFKERPRLLYIQAVSLPPLAVTAIDANEFAQAAQDPQCLAHAVLRVSQIEIELDLHPQHWRSRFVPVGYHVNICDLLEGDVDDFAFTAYSDPIRINKKGPAVRLERHRGEHHYVNQKGRYETVWVKNLAVFACASPSARIESGEPDKET